MLNLGNVVKYYKGLPHQKKALEFLEGRVSEGDAGAFLKLWREPVVAANPAGDVRLPVPFWPQTDNFTQPDRTCNSSSCAMFAKALGAKLASDNEYLEEVLKIGDTTDHGVHDLVLKGYGIKSVFRYDLGFADLDREIVGRKKPVVIGILHRGTDQAPAGGHMVVVVGKYDGGYFVNDPYGDLYDGYSSAVENGKCAQYSTAKLRARWLMDGDKTGWGRVAL